jgi:hypothetical protein
MNKDPMDKQLPAHMLSKHKNGGKEKNLSHFSKSHTPHATNSLGTTK